MTTLNTVEVAFIALREGNQINRLLLKENRVELTILPKNCPLL
jgi:hypothetical protein